MRILRLFLCRRHVDGSPLPATIAAAEPVADYDPRAWYLATYSHRRDWYRSTNRPMEPVGRT